MQRFKAARLCNRLVFQSVTVHGKKFSTLCFCIDELNHTGRTGRAAVEKLKSHIDFAHRSFKWESESVKKSRRVLYYNWF